MRVSSALAFTALVLGAPQAGAAQQMIINGGFETGGTGWDAAAAPGSEDADRWWLEEGGVAPISGSFTPPPAGGSWYAMSDQTGPGAGSLWQTFTVGGPVDNAVLSFDMFINNWGGTEFIGDGFNFGGDANQHGRVDLVAGSMADPFTLGSDVLFNAFIGGNTFGWTHFAFNIGQYLQVPGTYTLRFAQVDNQLFFNMGVDNVSLDLNTVPEPATLTLFSLGSLGLAAVRRRRNRA